MEKVSLLFTKFAVGGIILINTTIQAQTAPCINDVSDYSFLNGGSHPIHVVHADFNKDGKEDLATANNASNNISIVPGNGDGTFGTAVNYGLPDQPICMTTADYNNDTYADLAVTDWMGNLSVFLNNTSGGFNLPIVMPSYSGMISMANADFNKDGNIDIAVVGFWYTYILNGDGTGNFTATPPGFVTGLHPGYLVAGDINADSNPDLIVGSKADSLYVFLGNGSGNFTTPTSSYMIGSSVQAKEMALADFDQDGDDDLAIALNAVDSMAVMYNTGSGAFNPTVSLFKAWYSQTYISTGDYDGDGKIDIATAGSTLNIFLNAGGTFPTHTQYNAPSFITLTTADFNNDTKPDLASAMPYTNNCLIMINNGTGSFNNKTPYSTAYSARSLITNDFNKDGRNDVMVCSDNENKLSLLLGASSGYFGATQFIDVNQSFNALATADFNKDGNPDVAAVAWGVSLFMGNGSGAFAMTSTLSTGFNSMYAIKAGDLNNDGNPDLVTGDWNGDILAYLGQGDGTFLTSIASSGVSNNRQEQFVLADLNKDNYLDLISATTTGTQVHFYAGDGAGHFAAAQSFSTSSSPWAIAVADLNNDGNPDIITGNNTTTHEISVLLSNGTASFNSPVNYTLGSNGIMCVVISDMNGDAIPDIAAAGNDLFVLPGNGNGTFGTRNQYLMASGINDLLVMDVNSDTKADVVASSGNSNIVVAVSTASPTVSIASSATSICRYSSVTLSGQGAATYTWTGGVVDGTPFTPAATNTYTVTGATYSGCTAQAMITVTVNPLPTLTITPSATLVCKGSAETLTAAGANTYTWSSGVINGVAFYPNTSASYSVNGTDLNGCTNSASYYVTVDEPIVSITASNQTVCLGQSVTLTGNGVNTYTWTNGVTNGWAFTPSATAVYTVTGTNYNNCQASDTIRITVNSLPTVIAHASSATVCAGSATVLYGSGANSYAWTDGVIDNTTYYPGGTHTYTVTGTDANNCQNTATVSVYVNQLPVVTFTTLGFVSPVCSTAGTQTLTGGSPAGGTYSGPGVVSGTNLFLPVLPAGSYTLTYTYTDGNQCVNSAQDTVSVATCTTDLQLLNNNVAVDIYPNPTAGVLYLNGLHTDAEVTVINLLGITVLESSLPKEKPLLDITQFSAGTYYIKITQEFNTVMKKIELSK